jgi:hypothetical protein
MSDGLNRVLNPNSVVGPEPDQTAAEETLLEDFAV